MQTITIANEDFNTILAQHKKTDIHKFAAWYESLAPDYHFIKDKKRTFTKNSKNIYSCVDLKPVVIGKDITWDKVFFLNHHDYLESFAEILEEKGVSYWDYYLEHINQLPKKPINHLYEIVCYSLENKDFFQRNKIVLTDFFTELLNQSQSSKNHIYHEKIVNIFEFVFEKDFFDTQWIIIHINSLYPYFADNQKKYFLKTIFNNQKVACLNLDTSSVHSDILAYIDKAKNYKEEIGTGFHLSLDTVSFAVYHHLSLAEIVANLNMLNKFISSISEEQLLFWFIDSSFKSIRYTINAFPKSEPALHFIQDCIDIALNDNIDEKTLMVIFEEKYLILSAAGTNTKNQKKQEINKF